MARRTKRRTGAAPLFPWDALPDDLRWSLLDKLSLPDLFLPALTSREFRDKFRARCAEERARLISVGEDTLGKDGFCAFVTAFRDLMGKSDAYPNLKVNDGNSLIVTAAAEAKVMTKKEAEEEEGDGGPEFRFSIRLGSSCDVLIASLRQENYTHENMFSGETLAFRRDIDISIEVRKSRKGIVQLIVCANRAATTIAVGLTLAICTGDPGMMPSQWRSPLNTTTFILSGKAGKVKVEALIGPVRPLAESFTYLSPSLTSLTSFGRVPIGEAHLLGHVQVQISCPSQQ